MLYADKSIFLQPRAICIAIALMLNFYDVVGAAAPMPFTIDPQKIQQLLTTAEKQWLSKRGPIIIAGPKAFPPFHYYDTENAPRGMASDYISAISNLLDLKIKTEPSLPWPEVLEGAKERRIDLITCSAKTIEREAYLSFSQPYLSFPMVILTRTDAPFIGGLNDLDGKTVSFIKKGAVYDWVRRDNIAAQPFFVNTPIDALKAVSLGRAEAYIANLASATYLIQKNGLTNLKVAAPTAYGKYHLYIAVRSDWPEFVAIINKALSVISPRQHAIIRNRWLAVTYERGMDKSLIIKWIAGIAGLSAGIIAVVLLWNRRLSGEISERKQAENALVESELRFRTLFEQAAVGVAQIETKTGRFVRINQRYCDIIDYSLEEITGKNFMEITHPEDLQVDLDHMKALRAGRIREFVTEKRYFRQDGSIVWVNLTVSPMWEAGQTPDYHIAIVEDISDKKRSEDALEESRRRLTTLIGNLPGMAYRCHNDVDWKMAFVSDGSEALTGYLPEELIDNNVMAYANVIHPEDRQTVWDGVQAAVQENRPFQIVYRIRTANGEQKWVWEKGLAVQDTLGRTIAIEGFITDITERVVAEKQIELSLQEKEVLLKEVHHRVKNNMQIVQSLLSLQADKLPHAESKQPLLDSIHRIRSMALIHETLYRSDNMVDLDIEAYFKKVIKHLVRIYARPETHVNVSVEIEPIAFDLDRYIACGLIINELVSNAMKHAFSDRPQCHLNVSLQKHHRNQAILIVQDSGRGLPDSVDPSFEDTMGLKIVRVLAESQLHGKLKVSSDNGTAFHITFPIQTT